MRLIFDARVLTHKNYTGVENYTKFILKYLKKNLNINIAKPKTTNKYLAHFWNHLILPFKRGEILFCPANIAPIFVPKSKKLIVTIHDVAFLTFPTSFSKFFQVYYKFIMPYIIKRADKIITVSNFSKKEIIKYYSKYCINIEDKIEVIYPSINKIYKKIDIIKKKKQILYVGSINKRKNFISLIKAFELLNTNVYKLIIVGNFFPNFTIDNESEKILNKAKLNPNIEFKSTISNKELVQIFNLSTLFIFSSFYEGFGLPPLEAMACGTPVVTSNIASMPEVCLDAVIYFDPYNIDDIKNKIELILNNEKLQKQMINRGLERVKKFSWKKSAKEHLKVFKKVLNN